MDSKSDIYEKYTTTAMLVGVDESHLTAWSIGYFRYHIAPYLPKNKDAKILEIGCGYGRNIKALNTLGYHDVYGIDISGEQIKYATAKLGLLNVEIHDALSFLTEKQETYDAILLLDVLEHLDLEYSIKLIQLIRRSLKEGGVFIIQVPNALAPFCPNRHGDITHLRAYTTHSMEQHLRLGGFNEMCHIELPPHIHGIPSFIRRVLWFLVIKPLIYAFMLIANSDGMGGIYTTNMLTIAHKR